MRKVAFTIVAKNYIGLAKILEKSFLENNSNSDFLIFVSDEYDGDEQDVIVAKKVLRINEADWIDMSFKYDITEFCTSIKPFCFSYLFEKCGYDIVLYFDPDIYVFDSLYDIFKTLEKKHFYLTPHLVTPDVSPNDDRVCLQSGIFNLGFIGLSISKEVKTFLNWWESRLKNLCFDDLLSYTFTDQKWANFIPAFYPEQFYSSLHLGMDVAPWNYFERKLMKRNGSIYVTNRITGSKEEFPLLFVHYSGFNYKELISGQISRNRRGKVVIYDDVNLILEYYRQTILDNQGLFNAYIDLPYTYATYENGDKIDKVHRRIYRNLTENNRSCTAPFSVGSGTLHSKIYSKKMITGENVNRLSQEGISNLGSKSKWICAIMKVVYRLVGYKRYLQLLKYLKYFSRLEAQAFLVESTMSEHVLPQ